MFLIGWKMDVNKKASSCPQIIPIKLKNEGFQISRIENLRICDYRSFSLSWRFGVVASINLYIFKFIHWLQIKDIFLGG